MASDPGRLPPGRQPYDNVNGMRVGALAGGLLGALAGVLGRMPWLIAAGAVMGGAVGFWSERRKLRGTGDDGSPPADNGT